ncbi:AMP-binding protein [Aquihabitans daechungensis]|uniref:AMP-binding protein n=1 Tax=Aquihabitans daechungensis TaxID=1052257 RepID=UPI003B9F12AF
MNRQDQARISDVLLGSGAPDAPVLVDGERRVTYADLRHLVERRARELAEAIPVARGIVLLTGPPSVEWVVSYLATLDLGHVPLLAVERSADLEQTWAPALVVETGPGLAVDHPGTRGGTRPALHPELALLLSTSGSTGSPKLVRLSHANLVANAASIAASLELTSTDTGITSLPLHYCYGLSVLHSHLTVGASLAVVRASVVDPCFVAALERHGVTSLAGVPHTFELLEVAGAERIATSSLRLLTQAGGHLGADAQVRWRDRCAAWGVDFVTMYGQTEATARMAYLPPALAGRAGPRSVGIPVPGGSLAVEPPAGRHDLADDGVGELVYRGPNVMMGYGLEPGDLALGPTDRSLRTGDLGRFDEHSGTFEVVGRISRFTKPFGLRIDLDRVEQDLRRRHPEATVGGDDEVLVAVVPGADRVEVEADVAAVTGLPSSAVAVVVDRPVPRTAAGKVDQVALRAMAAVRTADPSASDGALRPSHLVAQVLGRPSLGPDETFTSAGGDSLSYVEASVRIEELIGALPDDWQHRPMAELDRLSPGARDHRVDTTILLRAAGICAVVATHMHLVFFPGGAHLLLAIAGYNLSRFHLGIAGTRDRLRATGRTVARVVVPTVAVALAVLLATDHYGWTTVALVNNYLGPRGHERGYWHFWFIEAIVQLTVVVSVVLAVPFVRRAERARPYLFGAGALAAALVLREVSWWGIDDPFNLRFRTHGVAFFFVLGWLVHRSTTTWTKAVTTVLCVVSIVGFFGQPTREAFVIGGIVLLVWARRLRLPRASVPVAAGLAAASMWIFISHFHLWPVIAGLLPLPLAYAVTLLCGIAVWAAVERGPRLARYLVGEVVTGRSVAQDGTSIGRSPGRGSTSGHRVPV